MRKTFILLMMLFLIGCERPMPRDISAKVENNKLYIFFCSPLTEHWYNKEAGNYSFNEKETRYLKEVLTQNQ